MFLTYCFVFRFVLIEPVLCINKVSRDCCVALPRGGAGLSAVCDCGIS